MLLDIVEVGGEVTDGFGTSGEFGDIEVGDLVRRQPVGQLRSETGRQQRSKSGDAERHAQRAEEGVCCGGHAEVSVADTVLDGDRERGHGHADANAFSVLRKLGSLWLVGS